MTPADCGMWPALSECGGCIQGRDDVRFHLTRERAFYRDAALLALPILLQNLCTTLLGLLDTFMVGKLGEEALAAVLVANIPVFFIQMVIFGLQSGSSVLISQYWGKRDFDAINRVMGVCCYAAGGIAAVFAGVMCFLPEQLMGLLTDNALLVPAAAGYARIVGASCLFNSLAGVYLGAQRSMENPKLGAMVFGSSMCVNIFLNWVLIFGKLGAPALGVEGAAWATLCARVLEMVIVVFHGAFNRRFPLRIEMLLRPGGIILRKFLHYSTPVVLNEALWGLGAALRKVVMGHMEGSTEILAAQALAGNIESLCTVAVFALGGTAAIIVGREIGAGCQERVYESARTLLRLSVMCGLLVGGLLILCGRFLFPDLIYPVFRLSPEGAEITTMMLTFIGVYLPVWAYDTVNIIGVFRGGGDVRMASAIDLVPLWLISLPLCVLFGVVLKWGIFWVYTGIALEQIGKLGFCVSRFHSKAWICDITGVERGG